MQRRERGDVREDEGVAKAWKAAEGGAEMAGGGARRRPTKLEAAASARQFSSL